MGKKREINRTFVARYIAEGLSWPRLYRACAREADGDPTLAIKKPPAREPERERESQLPPRARQKITNRLYSKHMNRQTAATAAA